MTWRWATSFNLLAAFWASACGAAAWSATISGRVELSESKDRSGVVVWLVPLAGKAPDTPPQTASISHRHKTFTPHVLAVRTGSKVRFPNLDPFYHNAFSNYDGEMFDIGLHPPGSSREVTFRRQGIVRLFCNIHPTMSAVIVVLDTPWFAATNTQGSFRVADVPPGEYVLKVFFERALQDVLERLERHVTMGPDDLTLPELLIAEAGYVAPPHKNKFGKDYPPIIVDQYPGGRR
jgi:plastocyanin